MNLPPRGPQRPGITRGVPQPPPRGRPTASGRPAFRPAPAQTNPLPIIFGVIGVLLVVLLFVVMSPGAAPPPPEKEAAPPPKPPAAPKPVDVSGLEREGLGACNDGLAKFKSIESKMAADLTSMPAAEKETLKGELQTILEQFRKGMALLNEANEKSGRGYDVKSYMQARKLAADKFKELGGKLDQH